MSEWKKCRIGDLVTLRQGFAINAKSKHYISKERTSLALLRIADMKSGAREIFIKEDIPQNFIAKKEDIIYTRTGNVGLVFRSNYGVVHNNCFTVTPNEESVLARDYLFYLLQNKDFYDKANSLARGAAQPDLPHTLFNSIEILYPSIQTQHSIATILSRYDSLIENYQKQIKLLEEAAQRLYKEWFVDLHFPGHENTKIVDGVPEGWEKKKLIEFGCTLESGSRPKGGVDSNLKDGIPSVGAENVIGLGKYNYSSEKLITNQFYSQMRKGKIKNRDILIYKDGAYIGRTSLFQDGFPHKEMAVNEHVFLLHTLNENYQYYVFFTLYQKQYFEKMQKLNKNAAQPGLNQKALLDLGMLCPSEEFVMTFRKAIEPLMKALFNKANQIRLLTEARDRLLPKLMNGEIEV